MASFSMCRHQLVGYFELVAEPTQEQQVGESQAEEVVEPVSAEVANPADLQGKPRSITLTLNL